MPKSALDAATETPLGSDAATEGIAPSEGTVPARPAQGRPVVSTPRAAWLIGPALVAGVAYLDPGNVASNMTAGAQYG